MTTKRRRKAKAAFSGLMFMPKTYVDSKGFSDEFEVYTNGDLKDKLLGFDWCFAGLAKHHFVFRREPVVARDR